VFEAAGLPTPSRPRESPAATASGPPALPPELVRPWMIERHRILLQSAIEAAEAGDLKRLADLVGRMQRIEPRLLGVLAQARPELTAALGVAA
jgi:hypothetical protein